MRVQARSPLSNASRGTMLSDLAVHGSECLSRSCSSQRLTLSSRSPLVQESLDIFLSHEEHPSKLTGCKLSRRCIDECSVTRHRELSCCFSEREDLVAGPEVRDPRSSEGDSWHWRRTRVRENKKRPATIPSKKGCCGPLAIPSM